MSFEIPTPLLEQQPLDQSTAGPAVNGPNPLDVLDEQAAKTAEEAEIVAFVTSARLRAREERRQKVTIWNECWELYRGKADQTNKEDWHSKIVMPKAFNSVKKATSTIKRLLSISKRPWHASAINPDDLVTAHRGGQVTQLAEVFMENANYQGGFAESLESALITGIGVNKVYWAVEPRTKYVSEQSLLPNGQVEKRIVRQVVDEGQLKVKAVDPYNFYWLRGSKLNDWKGTIEEVRISKWELKKIKEAGGLNRATMEDIDGLGGSIQGLESEKQRVTRHDELPKTHASTSDPNLDEVLLNEYYGPIFKNDEVLHANGHAIVGGGKLLHIAENPFWHQKPPYVAFSPLTLPFRTDGMGLIEMVREVDKALNQLTNLSMDTLLFRLLPIFEVVPDLFENPADFETGLTPGKFFRRSMLDMGGSPGIAPVQFNDISGGTVQVAALLDRAHSEGSLISEIAEGMPRYRGAQSAAESKMIGAAQEGFFGSLAADIEQQALAPLVEMCIDTMLQFLDTSKDPRVPSILGLGARSLTTLPKEELFEMVRGDYKIKVDGISTQMEKAEMLQNMIQFLNILGQNGQAWLPYVRQDTILRRILEVFRPTIPDIEDLIEAPEVAQAKIESMKLQELGPDLMKALPGLAQAEQKQQQAAAQQQQQQALMENQIKEAQETQDLEQVKLHVDAIKTLAEVEEIKAKIKQMSNTPVQPKETN
jgi:hypothetical protein